MAKLLSSLHPEKFFCYVNFFSVGRFLLDVAQGHIVAILYTLRRPHFLLAKEECRGPRRAQGWTCHQEHLVEVG